MKMVLIISGRFALTKQNDTPYKKKKKTIRENHSPFTNKEISKTIMKRHSFEISI